MATFEDNAVVTAEDLNNIADDLGDTTFSAFSEEKFGVDKLNQITADLVSKGILNTGNKCEAIIADGKVYIQSGVIVFESGAKIRIEEPVIVDAVNGSYIYAVNNLLTGKASIEVGESFPTEGDFVSIAQVNDAGEIVDLREMSVAKVTLSAELQNNYAEQTAHINSYDGKDEYLIVECIVVPVLPQCRYIRLKGFEDYSRNDTNCRFYNIELLEDYQVLFEHTTLNYRPRVLVKKKDGLLYFKATVFGNEASAGQATFILM